MKRILFGVTALLLAVPFFAGAFLFTPSGGSGGGGTTNASDLTSGVVAVARGGTGSGTLPTARTNLGLGSGDNVTFNTVTAAEYVSSAADNTRGAAIGNTADPTGANLAAGKIWYNQTTNLLKVRNGDNTANMTLNDVQWHRIVIDAPTTADNVVFAGPLERAQTIDNVLFLVQDNTGKLSGAATDNVTANVSYCSNIATPTCTNVFTSDQVVTGSAVSAGAMNNTAPSAGDYMRVTISAANMANKKLYIRIKYRSI